MTIVDFTAYRTARQEPPPDLHDDTEQNRLWDEFERLAKDAWEWRDHETLDSVIGVVAKLRGQIEVPIGSSEIDSV
jgi:hypothetical protein